MTSQKHPNSTRLMLLLALLTVGVLLQTASWASYGPPWLVINGERVRSLRPDPVVISNTMVVEAHAFFALIGGRVDQRGDMIRVTRDDHELQIRAGEQTWYFDGREKQFKVIPFMRGDSLMVPTGSVTLALGGTYNWDDDTGTAYLRLSGVGGYDDYHGDRQPRLEIYRPASGQVYNSGRVEFMGKATPGRQIRLRMLPGIGSFSWGSRRTDETTYADRSGDWRIILSLNPGRYQVRAELLNADGKSVLDRSVKFEVSRVMLDAFVITRPSAGQSLRERWVEVQGNAPGNYRIVVRGTPPGGGRVVEQSTQSSDRGAWSVRLPVMGRFDQSSGRYQIVAQLLDDDNRVLVEKQTWVLVPHDQGEGEGYGLTIDSPNNNQNISGPSVTVSGHAPDRGDLRLTLTRGNDNLGSQTTTADRNGDWSVRFPLSGYGTYRVVAQLLRNHDVIAERQVTFSVGNRDDHQHH
jgi:hypothetical protein